jgi:hypothetical protein
MNRVTTALAVVILSGCGGSFSGTVNGLSLNVADSIFGLLKDDDGKSAGLVLIMADQPNLCDKLKANREPKNSTAMTFLLFNVANDGSQLAPSTGDYTITSTLGPTTRGNIGLASFSKTDGNCTDTIQPANTTGQSGLVKLSSVNSSAGGQANGTFDITVGTQNDKVTGTIIANFCDISKIQANPNCE